MNRHCQYCSVITVLLLWDRIMFLKGNVCDNEEYEDLPQGNIGESGYFPWLGVLKVYLYQNADERIAMTGIVLVKEKFALANTDDIVRIPRKTFLHDTKAMFIPTPGQTWTAKVKDYLAHPEYPGTTINTIAVLELDIADIAFVPMKPICWPHRYFNADNHFYAIGFQDDTDFLEKYLYRMTYLKRSDCETFYNQSKLKNDKMIPAHFQCGHSAGYSGSCVWDTGMVMASNASGKNWTLVGFGVRGPGCSLPSRFIDIFPYIEWIDSATAMGEVQYLENRESAFNTGFGNKSPKKHQTFDEVPIHETFLEQSQLNDDLNTGNEKRLSSHETRRSQTLSFDPYQMKYDTMKTFIVNRIDDGAIHIQRFDEQYEQYDGACNAQKVLIYRDKMRLVDESGNHQTIAYRVANYYQTVYATAAILQDVSYKRGATKISLYDMVINEYTCIQVKVKSLTNQASLLWYTTYIDDNEGVSFGADETPKNLLKRYREQKMEAHTSKPRTDKWIPGPHMEAPRDVQLLGEIHKWNINLLIRLSFVKEAQMNISVFGPLKPALKDVPTVETKKAARTGYKAPQKHFQHDKPIRTFFKTGFAQTTEAPIIQSVHHIQPTIMYSYPFNQGAQYLYEKEGERLKFIYPGRKFQKSKSSTHIKNKILLTNTSQYELNDNPKNKYQNFYIIENKETSADDLRKLSMDTLEIPMSITQSSKVDNVKQSVGAYGRNNNVSKHLKHNSAILQKNISYFTKIPLNHNRTKVKTEESYIKKEYPKVKTWKGHFRKPEHLRLENTQIDESEYLSNLFVSDISTTTRHDIFRKGEIQMPILKADIPNIGVATLTSEKNNLSIFLKNISNIYSIKFVYDTTTIPKVLSDHKHVNISESPLVLPLPYNSKISILNKIETEIKDKSPADKIWINSPYLPPIIHKKNKNLHKNKPKDLSLLVQPLYYNSEISMLNKSKTENKEELPADKIWTNSRHLPPIIHKRIKNTHQNQTKDLSLLVQPLSYYSNISMLNKTKSESKKEFPVDKIWINSPNLSPIIHKKIKNTHKNKPKDLLLVKPLPYNSNISTLDKSTTEMNKKSALHKTWINSPNLPPIIHERIKNTLINKTRDLSLFVQPLSYNSNISTLNESKNEVKKESPDSKVLINSPKLPSFTHKRMKQTHKNKLKYLSPLILPVSYNSNIPKPTTNHTSENLQKVPVYFRKPSPYDKSVAIKKNISSNLKTGFLKGLDTTRIIYFAATTTKIPKKVITLKQRTENKTFDVGVKIPKQTNLKVTKIQKVSNYIAKDKLKESSTLVSTQTEISVHKSKVSKVTNFKSKHPNVAKWVTKAPKPSLYQRISYNIATDKPNELSTLISTQTKISVRTNKIVKLTNFNRKHHNDDLWVTRAPKPRIYEKQSNRITTDKSKESSTQISTQTEISVRTRKVLKNMNFKRKHPKGEMWVTRTPKPSSTTSFYHIIENVRNKRILNKNKSLGVSTILPWDKISTLDKPLQEYMKPEDPKYNSHSTTVFTHTSHEHDQMLAHHQNSQNYAVKTTTEPDDDVLSILGILTA